MSCSSSPGSSSATTKSHEPSKSLSAPCVPVCTAPGRKADLPAARYQRPATPGLTVDRHVRDVSGRPGIGVVWRFYGSKAMNIFDPRTFAYLGLTTWGEQGQVGGAAL